MRRLAGFAIVGVAVLCLSGGAVQGQPPSPGQPQARPPAGEASPALSPADIQQFRATVALAIREAQQVSAMSWVQTLHDRLDQVLTGEPLPDPYKATFVDLFAPHRSALHQFWDQEMRRLRQQLTPPSGPRSDLDEPSPVVHPTRWSPHTSLDGLRRPSMALGWLVQATTSDEGTVTVSDSQDLGNGMKGTVKVTTWVDTPDWVASNGSMGTDQTVGKVVGPVSGEESGGFTSRARVKRCPTADGLVLGQAEFGFRGGPQVRTSSAFGTASIAGRQEVTAEGHVGDDARLREVVLQAEWSFEKRILLTGPNVANRNEFTILRWRGTATFDPHGTEDRVPLQLTGCAWNQGLAPVAECIPVAIAYGGVYVGELQSAYLKAEALWNLRDPKNPVIGEEQGYIGGSKCVIAKFTPRTKTVRGHPRQSVQVKTELITVKGNQPTWGVFEELLPIWKGDGTIQADGTRTSPEEPAQLTYTAPSQQWPLNDPPGFMVKRATSRAGVIIGTPTLFDADEYIWLLAPGGFRLSIHERAEATLPVATYLSEVTFPMDLTVNERRQVLGQALVQREGRSQVMMGMCAGVEHWIEQWHASGILDEKTDTLTLKLWFQASPRQGTNTCKGPGTGSDQGPVGPPGSPMTTPYTNPGFRSDAYRSPLDQFTLPDKEGATQHFVIPLGPVKRSIDVTLRTEQGGAAAK
jgi:hypothetical protein